VHVKSWSSDVVALVAVDTHSNVAMVSKGFFILPSPDTE
jgi:hypothetical protein